MDAPPNGCAAITIVMGLAILILAAATAVLVGTVWLVGAAFQVHPLWGLAVIFVPFASLAFIILHWQEAKTPFAISLLASVMLGMIVFTQPEMRDAYRKRLNLARAGATGSNVGASDTPSPFSIAAKRAAYARHEADLKAQYVRLSGEHAAVQPGTSDVSNYNVKLVRYNEALRDLQAEKARLDQLDHPSLATPPLGNSP